MKSKIHFAIVGLALLFSLQSFSQFSVSVNVGTRNQSCRERDPQVAAYFYFPEIQIYYDSYANEYIYYSPRGWVASRYAPDFCRDYDFRRAHRVAVNYRGNNPYAYFESCRSSNNRNYNDEYYGRRKREKCKNENFGYYEKREKHYWKKHRYEDRDDD